MNVLRQIKFYSENDLAVVWHLNEIRKRYLEFKEPTEYSLEQMMELYNCTLYIDKKLFLNNWDDGLKNHLQTINKSVKGKIAKYFQLADAENLSRELIDLSYIYKEDFLELFFRYKLNEKVTLDFVENWLEDKVFQTHIICRNENFVKTYEDLVLQLFLKDPSNIKIFIQKYLKKTDHNEKKLYVPKIESKVLNEILEAYIESPKANLNYLKLLVNAKSSSEFVISPELKLKAQRRSEALTEEYFSNAKSTFQMEHIVSFVPNLQEKIKGEIDPEAGMYKIELDRNLFDDTEPFSVLYNFIHMFNYIDSNGRIPFVSLESENQTLELLINVRGKTDYNDNMFFKVKEMYSQMVLTGYYQILDEQGVYLEAILEWYFNEYIKVEFGISNYILEMAPPDAKYKEKCLTLFSEMEYLLTQYDLYSKYKEIDQELLTITSNGVALNQLTSLTERKYIYMTNELKSHLWYFFSDQSTLNYISEDLNAESFYELTLNNSLTMDDFEEYHRPTLNQLIDLNYLVEDKEKIIRFKNECKMFLLKDLYENETICYKRLPLGSQREIDLLIDASLVEVGATLFSKNEQAYFNYYLNNQQFQNGLQLRNRYMHRRQVLNEEQHKQNYLIGLKLLICIVLKINEEFCIAADEKIQVNEGRV